MALKTVRRDKLKRLCEQGKLVMVRGYHFDDMEGATDSTKHLPCAMKPADWKERKEGICYLTESDFKTKSGCAYENGIDPITYDVLITLIIHGNCNYTFRVIS